MQHRQNHSRVAAAFVTLSGLVLGLVLGDRYQPPAALAGDDKIFAPQFCVPLALHQHTLGSADFRVEAVEQTEDADYQTFICPLVRDLITGDLDAAWVRVGNERPEDDTPPICCVHAMAPLGGDQDFDCEEADDDVGRQSLEFDLDDFDESNNGYYVVTCELGFEDTIRSIRTSESD